VNAQGRLVDPKQFEEIVVKIGADGRVTHLHDVARVELGAADYSSGSIYHRKPRSESRSFSFPAQTRSPPPTPIYAKMAELKKSFPQGMDYAIPTTPRSSSAPASRM
jgi:multidrug efflux pump